MGEILNTEGTRINERRRFQDPIPISFRGSETFFFQRGEIWIFHNKYFYF